MANTDFSILLKAVLDKSGINTELKQVQEIVKKYSIDIIPELKTASLRNQMKAVSQEIANDFNKSFGLNLNGNDIFKAFENQAKQAEKSIRDKVKTVEDLKKRLSTAVSKYSYGDTSEASTMIKELSNMSGAEANIKKLNSTVNKIVTDLKLSHDQSLQLLNQEIKAEEVLQSQKEAFNKKNINAIDYEIAKREKEAKSYSAMLQAQMQRQQELQSVTSKIQLGIETGGYESKVENLIAKTNQWTDTNGNARISTDTLRTAINNLNNAYNAVTASGGNTEANQRALIAAEQALDVEIKKTTNDINIRNTQFAKTDQVDRLRQRYQEFYDKNTAAHRNWGAQLKAGMAELASGAEVPIQRANQLEKELIDVQNAARQAGKLGLSFFDRLKQGLSSFTMWTSTTSIVMSAIRVGKDMVKNVKEIDTAMTSLYKVTDETNSRYNRFLDSASKKAKELGRSVSSLVEQTAEWAKRGYSLNDAEKLAKTSSIYANVGEVDDATAVEDITTAMKAFNIEAEDSISIVDRLNALGNKYATSSADLGEGLKVSASALKLAGNDINQSLAMITGGTEITQNASEMGNAIKIMSMRIRGKYICLHTWKVCMQCYA